MFAAGLEVANIFFLLSEERTLKRVVMRLSSRKGFLRDVALDFLRRKERLGLTYCQPSLQERTHGSPLRPGLSPLNNVESLPHVCEVSWVEISTGEGLGGNPAFLLQFDST